MILYQENFFDQTEIEYMLGLWNENESLFSDYVISFYYINFMTNDLDLTPIQNGIFERKKFHKMRLQKYNESFKQIDEYHGHENIHNYIVFLNEDFTGGELEFENGLLVKPKKGSLVYFNNDEKHRVKDCIGDRYIFTALGDNEIDIKYKVRKKSVL